MSFFSLPYIFFLIILYMYVFKLLAVEPMS